MKIFDTVFKFVIDRMRERSTWGGVTFLAAAVGIHLNPDNVGAIMEGAASIMGTIYIMTKDK